MYTKANISWFKPIINDLHFPTTLLRATVKIKTFMKPPYNEIIYKHANRYLMNMPLSFLHGSAKSAGMPNYRSVERDNQLLSWSRFPLKNLTVVHTVNIAPLTSHLKFQVPPPIYHRPISGARGRICSSLPVCLSVLWFIYQEQSSSF